jgi:hypothetical protein
LPGWAETTPLRRARVMFAFNQLLEERLDDFAALITSEHAKVLSDAKGEVTDLIKGEFSENVGGGVDSWSIRPPQDWSGPDFERGKYRELALALAAQGLVALDPAVRRAFPDAGAVNRALRGLIEIAKNTEELS